MRLATVLDGPRCETVCSRTRSRAPVSRAGGGGTFHGVTTWGADRTDAGAPGSSRCARSSWVSAARRSARRSWCSTAVSAPVRSRARLSASRSWPDEGHRPGPGGRERRGDARCSRRPSSRRRPPAWPLLECRRDGPLGGGVVTVEVADDAPPRGRRRSAASRSRNATNRSCSPRKLRWLSVASTAPSVGPDQAGHEVGRRRAGRGVVEAHVGHPVRTADVGDERDRRDAALPGPAHRRGDSGVVGRLEHQPVADPAAGAHARRPTAASSSGVAPSLVVNRARTVAGRAHGSASSTAAVTASRNRPGASTTTSTSRVRRDRRTCDCWRSSSSTAASTARTARALTPGRPLSTRSTVASDTPACSATSRTRWLRRTIAPILAGRRPRGASDPASAAEVFLMALTGFPTDRIDPHAGDLTRQRRHRQHPGAPR